MKWFYMTFCDVTLGGPPSDEERERESGLSYRARSLPVVCPLRLFVTFAPRRCRWRGGAALSIRRPFKVSLSPHSLPSIEGSAL